MTHRPLDDFLENRQSFEGKNIYLHTLDGYRFEKLVAEIFTLHGYSVINVKYVGDAGRDLIIEKNKKRILIECKFHKGSVGRPTIQKLHSAVVVDRKADQGYVVTTGRFSQQAVDYVKNPDVPISLITLSQLRKLALEANIRLLEENEKLDIYIYLINDESTTHNNLLQILQDNFISKPIEFSDLFKIDNFIISYIPSYRIEYKIDHTTATSAGIIYDVHERGILHVNSVKLTPDSNLVSDYLKTSQRAPFTNDDGVYEREFYQDNRKLVNVALQNIIKRYSKNVHYVGRNNVRYSKFCTPKKIDVYISNISQILVPTHKITLKALKTKYNFILYETKAKEPLIIKDDEKLRKCSICNNVIDYEKVKPLVCNACGNVVHAPKWRKRISHGYYCDECGKTICRNCGYWKNKWIFLKHVLCEECASVLIHKGENIEKIPKLL